MIVNTAEYTRDAQNFLKTGSYCPFPRGTYSYREYWDDQLDRLINGYSVGGERITGPHYGYLNFCQIMLTEDGEKGKKGRRKIMSFPRYYDTDKDYFLELEQARLEGKGMIVAKARRKGFSYKNGWLMSHQFATVRNSVSIIGAYLTDYADNTVGMVVDNLNFLNKHTAFYRQRNPDRRDFMKAQFKETLGDGTEVWSGYMSEIHRITFKDDPFKGIGKSCNLFLFEEAGKWANLKATYRFTEPTWMDGEYMIGMPIIFGTGGDMEAGTMDFADMFYSPDVYNLRSYENKWDEGATNRCGYFIPDYKSRPGFIDEQGNSLEKEARESEENKRKRLMETTKSLSDIDAYISQHPFTPKEAFRRRGGNIFPTAALQDHLAYLETNKVAKETAQYGRLEWKDGKVEWKPDSDVQPVHNFPVRPGDSIEGCITIWEHPEAIAGNIPFGLYIAGTDPYNVDESEYSDSLGSTFIYKRLYSAEKTYHWPVAEYTGRPETVEDYYENVRKLLTYYNAICLYENQVKGMFSYFQTKYCTHLLKDQPDDIIKDIIKDTTVRRGKGIHMTPGIKSYLEIITRDWLKEETSEGKRNLTKIMSIPLLQELIAYNKDEGNFDRVIAFMLCILHNLDLYRTPNSETVTAEIDPFWTRDLFSRKFIFH